jgi:hypothetical protein
VRFKADILVDTVEKSTFAWHGELLHSNLGRTEERGQSAPVLLSGAAHKKVRQTCIRSRSDRLTFGYEFELSASRQGKENPRCFSI